ncbi:NAD-dependent epimerase/dehydratase family protein [Haploplasma axanthum]|uniref:NAD dependent epimerase/dehydratase family n=1 Tax=Haploplasma axanthum TaxID=29552 RepID=A0A449BEM7_HAPAX|nr:NAD-dependent epimerase/dehydratase family protein [Haploplasma axanthum]VEU80887.1 NAD dependent epimerase/dehydratase family [Haploplasma axanthum]
MKKELHVIIGANGPIGTSIYNELRRVNKTVIRVGRTDIKESDYLKADATNQKDIELVTKNATHVYLTIGLEYSTKVWAKNWPIIIDNLILAARINKFKIIFFDNIYLYGNSSSIIFEDSLKKPNSRKGRIRLELFKKLKSNMGSIDILIVRAPDFFGPMAKGSIIHTAFLENMIKGKNPLFLGNPNKKHSYGYTIDLARATVLLALDDQTYNQEWNLPSYQTNNIYEIFNLYTKNLNKKYRLRIIPKSIHRFLSLFIPILKEVYEMRYQFENDYILSYSKFISRYPGFRLESIEDAIYETTKYFIDNKKSE